MKRHLPPALLFLLSLGLYAATLAPAVATVFDDSLELQLALPTFAIIHPTGYPLYSLLGWLFVRLAPAADAALAANLFSALAAAGAVGLLFVVSRRLGAAAAPAFAAALLFAAGPVWWSQATIAEVYAFQGLLTLVTLHAALRWDETRSQRWLALLGLAVGLGLAHHRLTLLLLPGLLVFVLWGDPGLLRRPRAWLRPALALLAPLLLYGMLPLRAHVGSLDGSYAQIGFWAWVMGGGYSTFLRDNPFGIERGVGDLIDILVRQFGLLGVAAALPGLSTWQMQPRRFTLLALIGLANLLFASQYLVADIEVFLIPLFICWALLAAVGLTVLWDALLIYLSALLRRVGAVQGRQLAIALLAVLLLAWPAITAIQRLPAQDRSRPPQRAWGVYDYGQDMLHSLEDDAVVVGLLGEITLLRYFQRTQGQRPDVQTIAADPEPERLAAIAAQAAAGRPTYTTRPLAGLAERFRLAAAGPLVRVLPLAAAAPDWPGQRLDLPLTPDVTLAAWDASARRPRSGPAVRLRLLWRVAAQPAADFKISARLLDASGAQIAQYDDFPVRNSYPPTAWRPGEEVLDGYDLFPASLTDEPLTVQVILYDPITGAEIARWEQDGVRLAME